MKNDHPPLVKCHNHLIRTKMAGDDTIFETIKSVMYGVNAVSGEAAGYGMGLVMLGTGSSKV